MFCCTTVPPNVRNKPPSQTPARLAGNPPLSPPVLDGCPRLFLRALSVVLRGLPFVAVQCNRWFSRGWSKRVGQERGVWLLKTRCCLCAFLLPFSRNLISLASSSFSSLFSSSPSSPSFSLTGIYRSLLPVLSFSPLTSLLSPLSSLLPPHSTPSPSLLLFSPS